MNPSWINKTIPQYEYYIILDMMLMILSKYSSWIVHGISSNF